MSPRQLLVLLPLVLILSGCQQTAWKAGAGADDLKRDEQTCHAQAPTDAAAAKQCLRDKGWAVTDFNAPAYADTVPAVAIAPASTQPAVAPLSNTVSENPNISVYAENTAANAAKITSSSTAASAAATEHLPPDPLQQQSVQTWWKPGAQAADFNTDANACLTQLGEQHAPNYTQHLFTTAMVSCLRARGWYAGRDPRYTPLR